MPAGKHKSKTYRKLFVRMPGGETRLHYRRRKPKRARCGACGKELMGMPRGLPYKIRKLPKTARRPERPFGGMLCSSCMRELFKNKARSRK